MSDLPERIHKTLIGTIVRGLAKQPLVLKGGAALMLAYNLDHYSEDVDYDSSSRINLHDELSKIMPETKMWHELNPKKNTSTTSRVIVCQTSINQR